MRIVLLFQMLWMVFIGPAYAEGGPNFVEEPAGMSEKNASIPDAEKWYVGVAAGIGRLTGWDMKAVDSYYQSLGYYKGGEASAPDAMQEVKFYAGKPVRDFMDIEFGYSYAINLDAKEDWARYYNAQGVITSSRAVSIHALYASASFRPITDGRAHGLYLKVGLHGSQLQVQKEVTGNPANLTAIAAGDRIPEDGVSTGLGSLFGLGYDFRIASHGPFRVELNHYFKLGGTSFGKTALNVGFHRNF